MARNILPITAHSPAWIGYAGIAGCTQDCIDAVLRLLQYGDHITHVRILSSPIDQHSMRDHCLLLTINVGDVVAIKSGFGSGYAGEGSHGFSYVLQLLDAHGAEIEEYDVSEDVIGRVDSSSLTAHDLELIDVAKPVRPRRWDDYTFEADWEMKSEGTLWREFPPVVPFAMIDRRITDLALSFWDGPDQKLLTGYRRLEDIVRNRTGINEHGAKLFSKAFALPGGKLCWKGIPDGEHVGRVALFTGVYMAYRNPRAHREPSQYAETLAEFLLLNHLYLLEKDSIDVGMT